MSLLRDTTDADVIASYRAFWPFYLRQHAKPLTRHLHLIGTGLAVGALVSAGATLNGWLLLAVPLLGYGPAWYAHSRVEQNRPATFRYPLWSLVSDIRMSALWISGRLARELDLAGVGPTQDQTG